MAKDRKKLIHMHSSVLDKQPTAASLEVGEIAVNNAKDQEFLSLKNSDNKVVRFSSDEQIVTIMEKKEVMPYKGYVRGETGPSSTAGDSPTADTYGSYGITNNDLLTNKSNIVIKLNQVVAGNTIKHDKVNGAKDKYNKEVNPTDDGGLTDGAGFFIDMSRYAMQDANPQFSSTTNTCKTTLSGTTIIRGLDGSCGSLLDAKVATEIGDFGTTTNRIGTATTTISGDTTLTVSGTTTETHNGPVVITNNNNKTETTTGVNTVNNKNNYNVNTSGNTTILTTGNTVIHSDGKVGISAKGELSLVSSEDDIIITADDDICETAGNKATFYGAVQTNIGLNCDDSDASTTTNIYGKTINNNSSTFNVTGDTNIYGIIDAKKGLTKGITFRSGLSFDVQGDNPYNGSGDTIVTIPVGGGGGDISAATITYGDTCNLSGTVSYGNSGWTVPSTISNVTCGDIVDNGGNIKIDANSFSSYTSGDTSIKGDNTIVEGGLSSRVILSGQTATLRANSVALSGDVAVTVAAQGDVNIKSTGSNNNKVVMSCGSGSISVNNGKINISGDSISAYSESSTTLAQKDDLNINTSGDTNIKTTGNTTIASSSTTKIEAINGINIINHSPYVDTGDINIAASNAKVILSGNTIEAQSVIDAKKGLTKGITFRSGLSFDVQGDNPYNGSGDTIVTIPVGGGGGGGCDLSAATITYGDTCNLSGTVSYGNTGWTVPSTISNVTCGDIVDTNHNIEINASSLASITSGNTYIKASGHTSIESVNSNTNITSNNGGISIRSISGNTNIVAEGGGGVSIKSESNGTYLTTSGGNMTVHSYTDGVSDRGQTTLWSEGNTTIRSDNDLAIYTRNVTGQTTTDNMLSIKSAGLMLLESTGNTQINSSGNANIKSLSGNVNIISSGITQITSSAADGVSRSVSWNGANLNVAGTITASGAIYSSDKNLKENINFIDAVKGAKAARIPLRAFNFKDDETKRITYGVIAQEVLDSGVPELVHNKEDETLGVDYTSFLILRLSHLEKEIASNYRTIFRLIEKVSNLEKQLNGNNEDNDKK